MVIYTHKMVMVLLFFFSYGEEYQDHNWKGEEEMIKINKGAITKAVRDARYYQNMGRDVKSVTARIFNNVLVYEVNTETEVNIADDMLDLTPLIKEYLHKNTLNLAKTATKAHELVKEFVSKKEEKKC